MEKFIYDNLTLVQRLEVIKWVNSVSGNLVDLQFYHDIDKYIETYYFSSTDFIRELAQEEVDLTPMRYEDCVIAYINDVITFVPLHMVANLLTANDSRIKANLFECVESVGFTLAEQQLLDIVDMDKYYNL